MKKAIILFLLIVSLALNVFLLVVNHRLETIIDTSIQNIETAENSISIVDTIYGRKYVVDVDTITGYAKIVGFRNSNIETRDSIK